MGRKIKRWEIDPNDPRPVDEILREENAIIEEIEEKISEDEETESELIEEKEKFIFIRESTFSIRLQSYVSSENTEKLLNQLKSTIVKALEENGWKVCDVKERFKKRRSGMYIYIYVQPQKIYEKQKELKQEVKKVTSFVKENQNQVYVNQRNRKRKK